MKLCKSRISEGKGEITGSFSENVSKIVNYSPFSELPIQPHCPQITFFLELRSNLRKTKKPKDFTAVNEERFGNLL